MADIVNLFPSFSDLAADEVRAVVENLQLCGKLNDWGDSRRVPETLCMEIESLLSLLERELKQVDLHGP